MSLRRLTLGLAVAALAATGGTLQAQSVQDETVRFDISISGIPAGELTLTARIDDGRYEAGSRIRATGLIGAVARLRFDGEARGRIAANGRVAPIRYAARSRSMRSERETEILFEDGNPVRVSVVPPRSSTPDIAAQAGTLDPVSAAVALLRDDAPQRICNDRVQLFDGSRRSELVVGRPEARDGTFVCNGRYTRIEGEAHSVSDQVEWPFRLVFRSAGNGRMELQRIETSTRFGMAVAERRS